MAIRSFRLTAAMMRSTATRMSASAIGSCKWSSDGRRNRAAVSGSASPRWQRSLATMGSTFKAAARRPAAGASQARVCHLRAMGIIVALTTVIDEIRAELAHRPELRVALLEAGVGVQCARRGKRPRQDAVNERGRRVRIGVRAADGLRNDFVDEAGLEQIRRRQLQRL